MIKNNIKMIIFSTRHNLNFSKLLPPPSMADFGNILLDFLKITYNIHIVTHPTECDWMAFNKPHHKN